MMATHNTRLHFRCERPSKTPLVCFVVCAAGTSRARRLQDQQGNECYRRRKGNNDPHRVLATRIPKQILPFPSRDLA